MQKLDHRLRWAVALTLAGCSSRTPAAALDAGSDAGSPDAASSDARPADASLPDAIPPDARPPDPPAGLERHDWRTERGPALVTTTVEAPVAELFAVSDAGFVTRTECSATLGCTYTWRDVTGAPGPVRTKLAPVTFTSISPDGLRASFVALDSEIASCQEAGADAQPVVARGTLQLLDLATGIPSFELALRSNLWSTSAFTADSTWFFASPIQGEACHVDVTGLRSVSAPFAPPPGVDANAQVIQVADARRWLVLRDHILGVADPLTANSFHEIGRSPVRSEVTGGGWIQVYLGSGEVVKNLVSLSPDGQTRQTMLLDEDWFPFGSAGRFARVCLFLHLEGFRDCRVVDVMGQLPPANFAATMAADHPDDAVLLAAGAVVFVGPDSEGKRAVQRIDLTTGRREVLHAGSGELRALGDGRAALLIQSSDVWLIEADREEQVADHAVQVLTSLRLPPHTPTRQDDLAMIVRSPSSDQFALTVVDARTRRLATLTDHLRFTLPGPPFVVDDDCGRPWTTRHGGSAVEGQSQVPRYLHFTEEGTPATMWLLPVDLSAPPRRLGELDAAMRCHAPLASPDGHVGFAEDSAQGVRVTLSAGMATPRPTRSR